MKHIKASFAALAVGVAIVAAFASTPISAQAAISGGPASATRFGSAQKITQLESDRPSLTPDEVEVCIGKADEPDYNGHYSAITSVAYIDDCLGKPTLCESRADLQGKSSNGSWVNIKIGPTETGCNEAHASITSTACIKSSVGWTYRTEGVYKVVWPDGGVDEDSNISDTTASAPYAC